MDYNMEGSSEVGEMQSTLNEESLSEFLNFLQDKEHINLEVETLNNDDIPKKKRLPKRKLKEIEAPLYFSTEVFLQIIYPLSMCLSKNIAVGIFKSLDFMPAVLINHGLKQILFTEKSWNSLNTYLHLIECYTITHTYGKKTNVSISNCDIEVDNLKIRGQQIVRFKNVTKHDEKVLLSIDEFQMLVGVVPAINRYMKQLNIALPIVKDYLDDTIEQHGNVPLLSGPVDVSIYNRLPQEVHLYRHIKALTGPKEICDETNVESSCFIKEDDYNIYFKKHKTLDGDDSTYHRTE